MGASRHTIRVLDTPNPSHVRRESPATDTCRETGFEHVERVSQRETGREIERQRQREKERERECVCVRERERERDREREKREKKACV